MKYRPTDRVLVLSDTERNIVLNCVNAMKEYYKEHEYCADSLCVLTIKLCDAPRVAELRERQLKKLGMER